MLQGQTSKGLKEKANYPNKIKNFKFFLAFRRKAKTMQATFSDREDKNTL